MHLAVSRQCRFAPAAGGSVNSDDGEGWESEGDVLGRGDETAR